MSVPSVLVFAGLDPSGGAGIAADITAIAAHGAHALPVITALTVQDHNRVYGVEPVDAALIERQVMALAAATTISAVKTGIPGSRANAEAIARAIAALRARDPLLPVVVDPVMASGHGDALARGSAHDALQSLLALATVATPNLGEAATLDFSHCAHVLVTGGHGEGGQVVNRCGGHAWRWQRLAGEFHGSGCTLAAAIAARLACGDNLLAALTTAQAYVHDTLAASFSMGTGQRIPRRVLATFTR